MTTSAFPTLERTVGELVADRPDLARLFEKLGINYCCGGNVSLNQACRQRQLDPQEVARLVQTHHLINITGQDPALDPAAMTLTDLADHIQATHHQYTRDELGRIDPLLRKASIRHQDLNPHLPEVYEIFSGFAQELFEHMDKEESVLFPTIRTIDQTPNVPPRLAMSLSIPISVMEREHQHTTQALARMRELTQGFTAPPAGCNTYKGVMLSLQQLEDDMRQHIRKENDILFPKAMQQVMPRPATQSA